MATHVSAQSSLNLKGRGAHPQRTCRPWQGFGPDHKTRPNPSQLVLGIFDPDLCPQNMGALVLVLKNVAGMRVAPIPGVIWRLSCFGRSYGSSRHGQQNQQWRPDLFVFQYQNQKKPP